MDKANLNMINWAAALRGNRRKGVALLEAMLADPVQREALCADPDALSLIFGYGPDDPLAKTAYGVPASAAIAYVNSRCCVNYGSAEELASDPGYAEIAQKLRSNPVFAVLFVSSPEFIGLSLGNEEAMAVLVEDSNFADLALLSADFTAMSCASAEAIAPILSSETAMSVATDGNHGGFLAELVSKQIEAAVSVEMSARCLANAKEAIDLIRDNEQASNAAVNSPGFTASIVLNPANLAEFVSSSFGAKALLSSDAAMRAVIASEQARWACNSAMLQGKELGIPVPSETVLTAKSEWGSSYAVPDDLPPGAYMLEDGASGMGFYNKTEFRSASTTKSPYNKQETMNTYPNGYQKGDGYEIVLDSGTAKGSGERVIIFIGSGDRVVMHSYNVTRSEFSFKPVWKQEDTDNDN